MTMMWHPFDEMKSWDRIVADRRKGLPLLGQSGVQPKRPCHPLPPRPARQPRGRPLRPEDV